MHLTDLDEIPGIEEPADLDLLFDRLSPGKSELAREQRFFVLCQFHPTPVYQTAVGRDRDP